MRLSAEWEKVAEDTIKATIIARLDWRAFETIHLAQVKLGHLATINVRQSGKKRRRKVISLVATGADDTRVCIRQPTLGQVEVRVTARVGRGELQTPADVAAIARDVIDIDGDPVWNSIWAQGVWADVEAVQL
jgi:hypothetical protein